MNTTVQTAFTVSMDRIKIVGNAENLVYRMPHDVLCRNVVNWFRGVPPTVIVTIDSNDQNRENLRAKGATFAVVEVEKDLSYDMIDKNRNTKEVNRFKTTKVGNATDTATELFTMEVILNGIWQNAVDNARTRTDGIQTGFKSQDDRSNGIQNIDDSRVVCSKTVQGEVRFYLNYVVFKYLTDRKIVDQNGVELDRDYIDGFLETPAAKKQENREKEADKHGILPQFDPQIRQMKLSNIKRIKMLGVVIEPTE